MNPRGMIHHIGISCPKQLQAAEMDFWNILGFAETAPARRGLRRSVRWLVGDGCAVLLRLSGQKFTTRKSGDYVSLIRSDIERTAMLLEHYNGKVEWAKDYHGYKRFHIQSPSGRWVEVLEGSPSMKAGAPLEEGEVI